jgi:sec-independent protein translocase protein TatA
MTAIQQVALFAGGVGMPELLVILLILILIFGGSRIPGLARALGKSVKEFKKGQKDGEKDDPSDEKKDG